MSSLTLKRKKKKVLLLMAALPGPVRDTLSRYGVCEDAAALPAAPPAGSGCLPSTARLCGGGGGGAAPLATPSAGPDAAFAHYLSVTAALMAAAEAKSSAATAEDRQLGGARALSSALELVALSPAALPGASDTAPSVT
jgi:hypothetical protein